MSEMTFFQLPAAVAALCCFALACTQPKQEAAAPFDLVKAKQEIDATNQKILDLSVKGDSIGLANIFAADAKFMVANMPTVTGRKNIQTALSGMMNSGVAKVEVKAAEVWGTADLLAEVGETIFSAKDGAQLGKDKYITVWKKEDGQWKIFRDCSNSDLPLPAMPSK